MITSFFPGRVRLRAPIFKEADLVKEACSILKKSDAINSIENNLVTGSVLIEYEPEKVPMEKLLPMQDFFMNLAKEAQNFDRNDDNCRKKILNMLEKLDKIF